MERAQSEVNVHELAAPRRLDDVDLRHEHERRVLAFLSHAARHYQGALATAPEALQYLRQRGVTRDSVRRFALGYARPVWRNLHRVVRDHDDDAFVDSGLVICKEGQSGDLRFDRFRNRIMFPIRDVYGSVVGFGGRTLSDEECQFGKYMNNPESAVFRKRGLLYGLFEARQAIEQCESATLVEGYFDVVQLAQHGFRNTVATMGTACTHEQLVAVFAHTNKLTFCFDGDAAGRRAADAAMRAVLPFATNYRTIRFVFLPSGYDPDSLCRDLGSAAWHSAEAHAVSLEQHIVASVNDGVELKFAEGRARLLHQARAIWRALPAGSVKEALFEYSCKAALMSREEVVNLWSARSLGRAHRRAERQRNLSLERRAIRTNLICDEPDAQAHRAWMRLPSGRRLDLISPDAQAWDDQDLAIRLARTFRWGGESRFERPLSVAQHSLQVLEIARHAEGGSMDPARQLRELLHDAEEGFLGFDAIAPLKPALGEAFRRVSERLSAAVWERYALPAWDTRSYAQHKDADEVSAASEAVHSVGWTVAEVRTVLGIEAPILDTDPLAERYGCAPWTPWPTDVAAARFLEELVALQRARQG